MQNDPTGVAFREFELLRVKHKFSASRRYVIRRVCSLIRRVCYLIIYPCASYVASAPSYVAYAIS